MTATATINGTAIAAPPGALAYKYADPIDDACWIYDETELCDIRREDPSLIVEILDDTEDDRGL